MQQCLELRVDTFLREALDNMVSEIARQVFRCKYTDLLRRNPADSDPVLKDDPVFESCVNILRQVRPLPGRVSAGRRQRWGRASSTCSSATCST